MGKQKQIQNKPYGAYGKAAEKSKGKNSPIGHWEISGYIKNEPFNTYPNGFPDELLNELIEKCNLKGILCNKKGSGTDFLAEYGEKHIQSGKPIIYTSADSVLQIAAHENIIPVEELYKICETARKIADDPKYNIGTIIARPFIGENKTNFKRTYSRKDYEANTFGKTMLDIITENGKTVTAIGKIDDLFVGRGIQKSIRTKGNEDGIQKTIEEIRKKRSQNSTNLHQSSRF